MSVSEPDRHDLYRGVEEKLGRRRAETFMNLVADLVTKADLKAEFAAQDARLGEKFEHMGRQIERMGRKLVMWTGSMILVAVGVAFAAGRFFSP